MLRTLARVERKQPRAWVLDAGLVLGVLAWLGLRSTLAAHPVIFAVFSAVLVGTIVHRALLLMDGVRSARDGGADEPPHSAHAA